MANNLESDGSQSTQRAGDSPSGWLRIGLVAAASALAGGVAAAWWYRKTLNKLHESGENGKNPQFGISPDDASDDLLDEI
ncbi:MAG: hypothetical protein WBE38_00285 [Terracidiphilus sp.]|jgi:hypothetical protein